MSRAVPVRPSAKRQHAQRRARRSGGQASPAVRPEHGRRPGLIQRIRLGWLLGKFLALALLIAGGWAIWTATEAPQFVVRRVTVSGNTLIPAEEITNEIDARGTNIFQVRRARLERMLRGIPAVQDAEVQIRVPDQIHIVLRERVPVAVWDAGPRRFLVDAEGRVLREGSAALPVIIADDSPVPEPGDRVDEDAVRIAQEISPKLQALGLTEARLEYRPTSGITLLARGQRVALGFADNLEAKLDAYRAIQRHLTQTHITAEFIDVRFLNRPYFR